MGDTRIIGSQLPGPPEPEIFYGDDKQPHFVRTWLFQMMSKLEKKMSIWNSQVHTN